MKDFFVHFLGKDDTKSVNRAMRYFEAMFPDAVNRVEQINGLTIAYSSDHDKHLNVAPLVCKERNATLIISGDYDFPDSYINPVHSQMSKQELLLHLYTIHGDKLFEQLSGNFNILIFYTRSNKIKVINSRLGLYPLYYFQEGRKLMISSRLGIFRDIFGANFTNNAVVMQVCLYNYPIGSSTVIKDVFLLPASSILTFSQNELKIRNYWNIESKIQDSSRFMNFRDSVDIIDDVLDRAMRKKLGQNDKVGISLTGGWDGRLLLAYALKYVSHDRILLYSHGTPDAPDVSLPLKTSKKLNYHYVPILLNDPEYLQEQLNWAAKTVNYSDGARQVSRLHYLYNMSVLRNEHGINQIISGIGGSNLLKSSNYSPCDVFNKYIIELIKSDNLDETITAHYTKIKSANPQLFESVDLGDFISAINDDTFQRFRSIKDKDYRFIYFLIFEIERKYFGAELQSYKHLVTNYSPFFDDDFIGTILKTVFFKPGAFKGLIQSHFISLLYAKLTVRNNKPLAKEPTDRGFSMYEVANPLLFPVMAYKYYRNRYKYATTSQDYFNAKNVVHKYAKTYNLQINGSLNNSIQLNKLFFENYISTLSFLQNKSINNF
jgi:hypothetical protein